MNLLSTVVDNAEFRAMIEREFANTPDWGHKQHFLKAGLFSGLDFTIMVHASGQSQSTQIQPLQFMLSKLVEWGLVTDSELLRTDAYRYTWQSNRIDGFLKLGIADNILLGPSYIAEKYKKSVPAIYVRKGDQEYTGTAFLTSLGDEKRYVVTAAHNLMDDRDPVDFLGFGGEFSGSYKALSSDWIFDADLDAAFIPVAGPDDAVPVHLLGEARTLAQTISLGYPTIATTVTSHLLAHRGELNAVVKDRLGGRKLIVSNLVSPGSSGGPILDECGLCIGMVIRSLEFRHETGINSVNAGVPALEVVDFMTRALR
ncbi:serine protease [Rhizobium sp. OAE497]|uniref:S1 family peptidase n=1 Tax=Rhizobium sp. OAE497 TaxID=2663796 RepID=UPI0018F70843